MKTREFEKNQEFENLTKFTKIEIFRICIDQLKNSIFKKKDRIKLQKIFNFLQLCAFCIAAYDKNWNKSNYEAWQALFNVAEMS